MVRSSRLSRIRRRHAEAAIGAALLALVASCSDGGVGDEAGAILQVDDPDFRGALGDGRLSVAEAIELASGALPLAALDPAERRRAVGVPGADSPDRIRFAPGLRIAVRRQAGPVETTLPPLTGSGDVIEGNGASIDGSALAGEPQRSSTEVLWLTDTEYGTRSIAPLLAIAASGGAVRDLTIESFPGPAIVVVGRTGEGVSDVRVSGNTVQGSGRDSFSDGIVVLGGSNADGSRLADVVVEDNVLRDVHAAIIAVAGGAIGPGRSARACRLERVTIARNRIERPLTAILALAGQAALEAGSEDNLLADLEIVDNDVDTPLDVGILVSTTQPFASRVNARNRIERARIAGNAIRAPRDLARGNTAVFVTGGQIFAGGDSIDDALVDLTIEDNSASGVATGLLLIAGDAERCGPCAVGGSVIDGATMRRNVWDVRRTGIIAAAGSSFETAGRSSGNRLRDVLLEGEEIVAGEVGIVAAGALASGLPLGGDFLAGSIRFPGYGEPAELSDNRFVGLDVRDSRLSAPTAVAVQGCSVSRTEDVARSSGVERLALAGNVIEGSSAAITVLGAAVVASGSARGCEVVSVTETGNATPSGEPVAAVLLDQAAVEGAPADSVSDNRVIP